jgi:hypothetical protein
MTSPGLPGGAVWNPNPANTAPTVPYAIESGYITIQNSTLTTIAAGSNIAVELDNAEWFFRANNYFSDATSGSGTFPSFVNTIISGVAQNTVAHMMINANSEFSQGPQMTTGGIATATDLLGRIRAVEPSLSAELVNRVARVNSALLTETNTTTFPYHRIGNRGLLTGDTALGWIRTGTWATRSPVDITYDWRKGIYIPRNAGDGTVGTYLGYGWHSPYASNPPAYNGTPSLPTGETRITPTQTGVRERPYLLDISPIMRDGAYRRAVVTVVETLQPGDSIRIPLVIRVTADEEVVVRVVNEGFGGAFSTSRHLLVAGGTGSTTAHVVNPVISRDVFAIERLVIRELRANSIRRTGGSGIPGADSNWNAFDLVLDPGFYFGGTPITNGPGGAGATTIDVGLELTGGRGLTWGQSVVGGQSNILGTAAAGYGVKGIDYIAFFPDGYEGRKDRLRIALQGFTESMDIPGSIFIDGLEIWAEENAPYDVDINIRLENTEVLFPGSRFTAGTSTTTNVPVGPPASENWTSPTGGFVRVINTGSAVTYQYISGAVMQAAVELNTSGGTTGQTTFFGIGGTTNPSGAPASFGSDLSSLIRSTQWTDWQPVSTVLGLARNGGARPTPAGGLFTLDQVINTASTGYAGNGAITVGEFRPIDSWGFTTSTTTTGVVPNSRNAQNMITAMTLRAGTRRDWGIILRAEGTIPELISGRYEGPTSWRNDNHKTATAVFEENVPNSWWAGRQVILTLPEDVRWRSINFVDVLGTRTSGADVVRNGHTYVNIEPSVVSGLTGWSSTTTFAAGGSAAINGVRFDKNQMFWNDVLAFRSGINASSVTERNERALLRFNSWVSIAADFEGDIVLTASGSAIPNEVYTVLPSAIIATALPPVRVRVVDGIEDVRIGFQNQSASTIEITESRTGALMRDRNVRLSITDLVATDILFDAGANIEVTTANGLIISGVTTGIAGTLYGGTTNAATLGIEANRGTLSFNVDRPSHSGPGTITISNVHVRVDRTVPETNDRPYQVIIWGTGIANNFGPFDPNPTTLDIATYERTNNDRFSQRPGIFTDYVRVVTGGDGSNALANEVRIRPGDLFYTVNGVPREIDVEAFLDPATSSLFVPIRFIANAYGITDNDIVWDNVARTATLRLPTGRIVQFQAGNTVMLNNGVPINIVNAVNEPITPVMHPQNSDQARMFLPMRFFGEVALGVSVDWDAPTQTAIFNKGASPSN